MGPEGERRHAPVRFFALALWRFRQAHSKDRIPYSP